MIQSNREQLTASYGWYRQMRETQPVFFDQKLQRVWQGKLPGTAIWTRKT